MRQRKVRGILRWLCEAEVFTYSQQGHHLCYHAATVTIDGHRYCRQHARCQVPGMAVGSDGTVYREVEMAE